MYDSILIGGGEIVILKKLVEMSNKYGSNTDLVIAGGGNTSVKIDNILYVKGSGTSLATITSDEFVAMDMGKLTEIMKKTYPNDDTLREAQALEDMLSAKLQGQEQKRPSVETLLHSLFKKQFVLHLHPSKVNAVTCSLQAQNAIKKLFGDKFMWVDSCKPGYILAKTCIEKMKEYERENLYQPDVIFLQNHGIFLAAENTELLEIMLEQILTSIQKCFCQEPDFTTETFDEKKINDITISLKTATRYNETVFDNSCTAKYFSKNPADILKPFTPDHIVYCNAYPLLIIDDKEIADEVNGYIEKYSFPPKVVIVKNIGIFCLGNNEKDVNITFLLVRDSMKIALYSKSFGGPRHMTSDLIDFIVNWEAEAYRSKI